MDDVTPRAQASNLARPPVQEALFDLSEKVCTRCKQSKPLHAFNRYNR